MVTDLMKKTADTLTEMQRRAVTTVGRSLLVSAAAGAGKTRVLAERIAYLVGDLPPPQRCRMDELLVVTFAESAAAEMRTRIAGALRQRLHARPHQDFLREQLCLLDAASISTIHAFCSDLLRRWFPQAGVDPQFDILDQQEAELLAHEVLDDLFLERLAGSDDRSQAFQDVVRDYADSKEDALRPVVLRVYRFMRALADPREWIDMARRRVAPGSEESLLGDPGRYLRTLLVRELEVQRDYAVGIARIIALCCPAAESHIQRAEHLGRSLSAWLDEVKSAGDPELLSRIAQEIAGYKFDRARAVRNLPDDEKAAYEAASGCSERIKDLFKGRIQKRLCGMSVDQHREGLLRIARPLNTLLDIVLEFEQRFSAVKAERSQLDFDDLQRKAFELLTDSSRPVRPSEVARQLQRQYRHVLVDEFQDVDPLQEAILRIVSREMADPPVGNLFAVGDIKQCIYQFRLAEPGLFADRQRRFEEGRDDLGEVIFLQDNFRSRPEVINAINELFGRLMSASLGGTDYGERARLHASATFPAADEEPVFGAPGMELHILEKVGSGQQAAAEEDDEEVGDAGPEGDGERESLEDIEREALLIGRHILTWMNAEGGGQRRHVADRAAEPGGKPTTRPIEYRDIVILLRTLVYKAEPIAEVLRRMGIPVQIERGESDIQTTEFRDVFSLLQVLDNPRQDLPLTAVLRSPWWPERLTENDLLRIRLFRWYIPFHEAVEVYARQGDDQGLRRRVELALRRLNRYRGRIRQVPIAQALWEIYEETQLLAFVAGLPWGLHRRQRLIQIHEFARRFGQFSRQGLRRFLRFLEEIVASERGREMAAASALTNDAVRIMTIHTSKGLEFPVVIVADLSRKFNLRDLSEPILMDRAWGLALQAADAERMIRYPTLLSLLAESGIRQRNLSEEVRILYVALTRAREHLMLVGRAERKTMAFWRQLRQKTAREQVAIPQLRLETAENFIRWVAEVVATMPADLVRWSEGLDPSPSQADAGQRPVIQVYEYPSSSLESWRLPPVVDSERARSLRRLAELEPLPADEPRGDGEAAEEMIQRLQRVYPGLELTTVPARVSVGALNRRWDAGRDPDERPVVLRAEQVGPWRSVPEADWPARPSFAAAAGGALGAGERGTRVHRFLQTLDLSRPCDADDLRAQWRELCDRGVFPDDMPVADAGRIMDDVAWFFGTDLGRQWRDRRDRLIREWAFVWRVAPDRVVPDVTARDARDVVLVRGIADAVLVNPDGLEILDYKTDAVAGAELDRRIELYRRQVMLYAEALSEICRRPVTAGWLIFLTARKIVPCSPPDSA